MSIGIRSSPAMVLLLVAPTAMAIDVTPLWDFAKPDVSEQRFRAALASSSGDDALVLQTQIARTYGLRGQFARAQALLKSIEPQAKAAGPEVQARYSLELGRTYASAAHPPDTRTADSRAKARTAFLQALNAAHEARLDGLAIDAIHMLAFVDTAPADQLKWAREALSVVEASTQPDARRWEASVRNNIGYALHQLGRYEEALEQFTQAVRLREQGTNALALRSAKWMVAWTLRALDRGDEALAMQIALESEGDAAGQPDPHVFRELEILHRARGDEARARHYAERGKSVVP